MCYSVETRKIEEGTAGEDRQTLPSLGWPGFEVGKHSSLLGLQDHPLLSVPIWPPDRLFTKQSQRAQNIPASSAPPDPLPQGTG